MRYYDARNTHFVCICIENYYSVLKFEGLNVAGATQLTLFFSAFFADVLVFFCAQSINRYSFRVEELSFSSSRLTFSIHLYRNHMAFSMNNTHAHTHKEISNPMRRLSVREYIYNVITCIAIVAICWWINMLQIMDHLMIGMLISAPRTRTRTITTQYSTETFNSNFIMLGHFFTIKGTFLNVWHTASDS